MFTRANPIDDVLMYAHWAAAHPFCAACGAGQVQAVRRDGLGLSTHHLIKRGRSDEPTNLLRLCSPCHRSAEGERTVVAGGVWPALPPGACLTLKMYRDRPEWDPARLAQLLNESLPALLPVPAFFERQFRSRSRRPRLPGHRVDFSACC